MEAFYGKGVSLGAVLEGGVEPPEAMQELYRELDTVGGAFPVHMLWGWLGGGGGAHAWQGFRYVVSAVMEVPVKLRPSRTK